MADITREEIDKCRERMQNCLEHPKCRTILEKYLEKNGQIIMQKALELWEAADKATCWDETEMMDSIDDLDRFNTKGLKDLNDDKAKLQYTKDECCRILDEISPDFNKHLLDVKTKIKH